ncbi:MAG TPA: penicillin acylase family protein [Candidatus Dormibacteraeota bacterium]|nr:penicillin acylase family protein [Candidatus Dormibacteraeota bacterium]
MRAIGRLFFWILAIFLVVIGTTLWWFVYRPLPQLDGTATLPGLKSDVTVERDNWGVPHIKANSLEDMAEAQGYVIAQDRLWQMDLLRRVGRGQLCEIVGPGALKVDQEFRQLNFARAAEREVTLMDAGSRNAMEAYARGVNHFIEQHQHSLPVEFSLLHYKPEPWKSSDSLIIAAYMYQTLSSTWESELNRAKVTARVGPERAKDLFSADAAMDRFVVGAPDGTQADPGNSGDEGDDPDDTNGEDVLKTANKNGSDLGRRYPDLDAAMWPYIQNWLQKTSYEIRKGLGSNSWVVSGAHTASGKPLLANDTHLELTVPPIWYEIHLTAPGWNVKGFSLPGAPMVVIGHNDRIAWGFTNNGADVQDLYIETMNPAAPDEYLVNKKWAKAQVFDEVIHVKGASDEHLKLVVTRHGPVVHREGEKAYALRWTATEPGGLANTYSWLGHAQNWDEFREILKRVWGPAQNVVYADVAGNIGYVMAARVPIRKKGRGELPVPGDTDDYEWNGYIPFEHLPQDFNPQSGLIVTANAKVVGPKYKPYLTDRWEEPYRTARIYDLLHDKHDLRPADMLHVETDTYSYPHVFLAGQLLNAAKVAKSHDPRAQKLIADLKDWNGIADADSSEITFLEALRRKSLELLLEPYLGDTRPLYEWRDMVFLQKVLTERPARWLPSEYKSYDELLMSAADQAVATIASETKSERPEDWSWKRVNALNMMHPLGRAGLLKRLLSMGDQPQSGTEYSPRAASSDHGPSQRFVADFADWDNSIMLIPAGQSGQPGSEHYTDQFSYWYEGKPILSPFSDAAEGKTRKHTLTLKPATQ